jgi:hypothetical protein
MNCNELEDYLHEFLDNELARDKRTEVANHLASCRRCAIKVAQFEQADRQLAKTIVVEPPGDFLQNVRFKIEAAEAEREGVPVGSVGGADTEQAESLWARLSRRLQFPVWVKFPLAAAAVLTLALVIFGVTRVYREWEERQELAGLEVDDAVRPAPKDNAVISPREGLPAKPEESLAIVEEKIVEYPRPEPTPSELEHASRLDPPTIRLADPELLKLPALPSATEVAESATNTNANVAVVPTPAPPVIPTEIPATRSSRVSEEAPRSLAKYEVPALTTRSLPLQSGWLDLGTRIFYAKPETSFAVGGYIRGRLDGRDRLTVTSTQVEGMIELLDAKQAAVRGTHGWLELTSLRFVASRPGFVPSYPYIEGYQDEQGEFHPISRRIYRAGD